MLQLRALRFTSPRADATNASSGCDPRSPPGAAAHRHGALRGFAIAYDQHVGNLLKLRLTDLISNLLLALIDLRPESGLGEPLADGVGVRYMPVGNRQHDGLHRREPQRKRARIVLDEDRDEPLEAAEDRPMDHDRAVLRVVGADVLQVEALRASVVELNRRALPLCARSRR